MGNIVAYRWHLEEAPEYNSNRLIIIDRDDVIIFTVFPYVEENELILHFEAGPPAILSRFMPHESDSATQAQGDRRQERDFGNNSLLLDFEWDIIVAFINESETLLNSGNDDFMTLYDAQNGYYNAIILTRDGFFPRIQVLHNISSVFDIPIYSYSFEMLNAVHMQLEPDYRLRP